MNRAINSCCAPNRKIDATNAKEVEKDIGNKLASLFGISKNFYFRFFFLELCSLAILIVQTVLVDLYLRNNFIVFGFRVIRYYSDLGADQQGASLIDLSNVYPDMGLCNWSKYGRVKSENGTMVNGVIDLVYQCSFHLNHLNRKMFALLWVLFFLLYLVHFIVLLHRILTMLSSTYRYLTLDADLKIDKYAMSIVCRSFGHLFLINHLLANIELKFHSAILKMFINYKNSRLIDKA